MSVVVRQLPRRSDWIRALADWHYAEWGALYGPDWSWRAALDELNEHSQQQGWPTTLIADCDGELIGSVSLVEQDAPALDHLGAPWLASLFVLPAARGQGVAKQLVQALCTHAAEQGVARLPLFTPRHREYYQCLGWDWLCSEALHDQAVDVLSKTLTRQVAA